MKSSATAMAIFFMAALLGGCGRLASNDSTVKFDSATSVAYELTAAEAKIVTISDVFGVINRAIDRQLKFTVGQFNGMNGVADLNRTQVRIKTITPRGDGKFDVTYEAHLFVSLPRSLRSNSFDQTLILPSGGDTDALNAFFLKYGSPDQNCLDSSAHEVTSGGFWYYYRPEARRCELADPDPQNSLVRRFQAHFQLSAENTTGKSPEYEKIWEDGRLEATVIFSLAEFNGGNSDDGTKAYNEFYSQIRRALGSPSSTSINLGFGRSPGIEHPEVVMTWQQSDRTNITVNMFLIKDIKLAEPRFAERYNKLTETSDFVSYNGHSGMGANIQALSNMGHFIKGQYQIFLINGCDTFAYVDSALSDAHLAVNPEFSSTKYIDILTNSMPAIFQELADSNVSIIKGLLKQQRYREILAKIDDSQKVVVTGEEDNLWPQRFDR
jgi:hypothetical protein